MRVPLNHFCPRYTRLFTAFVHSIAIPHPFVHFHFPHDNLADYDP